MSGIGWNAGQVYAPTGQGAAPQSTGVPQMPLGQPAEGGGRTAVTQSIDSVPLVQPQQEGRTYSYPQQPVYGQQPGNLYTPQNFQPQGYGLQQPLGQQPQGQAPQPQGLPPQQFQQQPAPGVYGPQQGQMTQQTQLPQQPQPGRIQLDDNTIIDGAGVPQELRGRTWGEARRLYSALATDWLQRNRQPQTPAQQSQQQIQQGGGLPPQQFGAAQPSGGFQQQGRSQSQQPYSFYTNPDERIAQVVREQIEQTVLPALQPVVAQSQSNGILQARNIAATGSGDWQTLEPYVMEMLASADPRDLQNPQVWVAAANMVRGQLVAQGRYQQPQRQQQVPQAQPQLGPGASQPSWSYFTESPSAPSVYGNGAPNGAQQPTQEEILHAQRFQMDVPTFMAWKYGQPTNGGGTY